MTTDAATYARRLLLSLGLDQPAGAVDPVPGPVLHEWRRVAGDSALAAAPLVAAQGCLLALRALAPEARLPDAGVLTARLGAQTPARTASSSVGGATRLLTASDGAIAVSLAREADLALVPALVEDQAVGDPWEQVAAWLATRSRAEAATRLELLSLPYALPSETTATIPWEITRKHPRAHREGSVRVVSFAALWAGPLCAQVLHRLGCDVVKIEDPRRPDGARAGSPELFAGLHEGVQIAELPLGSRAVADLVEAADIVIEGSRPRALRQVGLVAEEHRGTWVSITGHGRDSDRVAYGDDAAVSGGLVGPDGIVGDAVADPLTGLHAALAAWACRLSGGGALVDVALARTAAAAAGLA